MLDKAKIQELAIQLDEAEKTGQQIRQFSLQYPEITIDDAYAIVNEDYWIDW